MPIVSGGGGGGGAPPVITRAQYFTSPAVSIANTANANLPWQQTVGTVLLDLTAPTAPAAVVAGVYAFTVRVASTAALTANGRYEMAFDVDRDGEDPQVVLIPGASSGPSACTASITYYCAAGAIMQVNVFNRDGAASRDFNLFAVVQRLS